MPVALLAALTLVLAPLERGATEPVPADRGDARYLAFADRMVVAVEDVWDERAGFYRSRRSEPQFNANLLLVYSVAAQAGHRGPARRDERARRIARRLVQSPAPYVVRDPPTQGDSQTHAPGWTNAIEGEGLQHLVFDADLVDGLAAAYGARHALGLPASTARRIADAVHRTASGRFWRWPAIRLNQISWYAQMYAADATVTGDGTMLREDLRKQVVRFARRSRANFGPGLGFRYLPHRSNASTSNVDTAEYASITLSAARFLEPARAAGMRPLPRAAVRLLRDWARRAVAGYWTHGGYLNWDTGLGFKRWHQTKKLGLSQQALIGIASSPTVAGPRLRAWAKWMLDRGFVLFDRWSRRAGGVPPGLAFGVHVDPQSGGDARLGAARMAANAARAVAAGLGDAPSRRPPALYAYDPGTGRLAVTTPHYNTAIVPVSHGAFPYGGLDLARLFDGDQRVAAGIGGRPPSAFGLRVRDLGGRTLLATQRARTYGPPPVRLTRAPAGVGVAAATGARRAYAGPFRDLRLRGETGALGLRASSAYRFRPRWIDASWTATSRTGAPLSTDALFPTWGDRPAIALNGHRLDRAAVPIARGDRLTIRSGGTGYSVTIRNAPPGASARLVPGNRQASAPRAGPSIAIGLTHAQPFARTALGVRIRVSGRSGRR